MILDNGFKGLISSLLGPVIFGLWQGRSTCQTACVRLKTAYFVEIKRQQGKGMKHSPNMSFNDTPA